MTYFIVDLILAALIAVIRLFLFQLVLVRGHSMLSALENGQILFASRLDYRLRAPKRHEIVICRYPGRRSRRIPFLPMHFVKRVIGLPGETVEIRAGVVYINNTPLAEPYLDTHRINAHSTYGPVVLGENEFFVMGDNRRASNDSRSVGPLSRSMIVAHVRRRLFPVGKAVRFY